VLNKEESFMDESFSNNLLEYPQYTRPEEFMGRRVPDILLSGHHKNIDIWRKQKSIERTLAKRPELLEGAQLDEKEMQYLNKLREEK
jgi:tRNA (guanine37-N1)-methyltransferase